MLEYEAARGYDGVDERWWTLALGCRLRSTSACCYSGHNKEPSLKNGLQNS